MIDPLEPGEIDLGHEHYARFFSWHPDDVPANRAQFGYPLPNVEKAGLTVRHPSRTDGSECLGSVHFDTPEVRASGLPGGRWQVQSLEPATLTISPSLLCSCGDHGFIQQGRWVPA